MRVLFIGHSAHLSGAPQSLLRMIIWLSENRRNWKMRAMLGDNLDLFQAYSQVIPTVVSPWAAKQDSRSSRILRRLTASLRRQDCRRRHMERFLTEGRFDVALSNTVMNLEEARAVSDMGIPLVCRVAELPFWIDHRLGRERFLESRRYYHRFVAVSDAVKRSLVGHYGISPARIDTIHGAIPSSLVTQYSPPNRAKARARFGLAPENFVVGGVGTLDWRKGWDLFVATAVRLLRRRDTPSRFVFLWLGGSPSEVAFKQASHDIEMAGLQAECRLLGSTRDTTAFYSALDVLFLSSREDPFPLVVLEAAAAAVPTICFAKSGGAPEFVGDDAGIVADYLDGTAVEESLLRLASNAAWRTMLGAGARAKVASKCTADVQFPKFVEILESLAGESHQGGSR